MRFFYYVLKATLSLLLVVAIIAIFTGLVMLFVYDHVVLGFTAFTILFILVSAYMMYVMDED